MFKTMEDIPLYISAPQLAALLGISRSKAYELFHTKGFPARRIGMRRIVCAREDLLKWLDTHKFVSEEG